MSFNRDFTEINILRAGLCGSDINKIKSENFEVNNLGHEGVGQVQKANQFFEKGEIVVVNPFVYHSICQDCKAQSFLHCIKCESIGKTLEGVFSGKLLIPSENLSKFTVPSKEIGVGVFVDGAAVVFHALHRIVKRESIKKCLVIGSGTLGILFSLIADEFLECDEIHLVYRNRTKKKLLEDIFSTSGVEMIHHSELEDDAFELIVEAVGGSQIETLNLAISKIKSNGEIVVLGAFDPLVEKAIEYRKLFYTQVLMHGVNSYCKEHDDFTQALNWVVANDVRLRPIITHIFPLSKVASTLEKVVKNELRDYLKIVFTSD